VYTPRDGRRLIDKKETRIRISKTLHLCAWTMVHAAPCIERIRPYTLDTDTPVCRVRRVTRPCRLCNYGAQRPTRTWLLLCCTYYSLPPAYRSLEVQLDVATPGPCVPDTCTTIGPHQQGALKIITNKQHGASQIQPTSSRAICIYLACRHRDG